MGGFSGSLITPIPVALGGTSGTTAAQALANLGAPTQADLNNVQTSVSNLQSERIGTIFFHGGNTPPVGALALPLAQTLANIASYPALAAKCGTVWGGDGVNTFGLPYVGADGVLLQPNGNIGTTTLGQSENHSHSITSYGGSTFVNGHVSNSYANTAGYSSSTNGYGGSQNTAAGSRALLCVWYK
jgi:microcystin-dependent protein